MHAIVTTILKLAHNYRQDGREMTFYTTHPLDVIVKDHCYSSYEVLSVQLEIVSMTKFIHLRDPDGSISSKQQHDHGYEMR